MFTPLSELTRTKPVRIGHVVFQFLPKLLKVAPHHNKVLFSPIDIFHVIVKLCYWMEAKP